MIALGLDGYKGGWVAVRIEGNSQTIHFLKQVDEIVGLGFDRVAIDIPIGLPDPDWSDRKCDTEARGKLSPHWQRVFLDARRELWESNLSYDQLNASLVAREKRKITKQMWFLRDKIREVDKFVLANRHLDVVEAHPELVFLRLNNGAPLASKKSATGVLLRTKLLKGEFSINLDWIGVDPRNLKAGIDDVLDACACAIAARDVHLNNCIPKGKAPADAHGLPMQIWY